MKKIFMHNAPDSYALVDDDLYEYLNQFTWSLNSRGYALTSLKGQSTKTMLMHRLIMNTPQGMDTDHINGDGLCNIRSNLRICTRSENNANARRQSNNTSGYKGISLVNGRWTAYINRNGKREYLGSFADLESARKARRLAGERLYGNYYREG